MSKNGKISIHITIDDKPIMSKSYLFDLNNNDLVFKNTKKSDMQGGWIAPLLTSLIPLGIDLFGKLLSKGNGMYGGNFLEENGVDKKTLKKKIHNVKIFDNKGSLIHKFKTSPLGGALLSDDKFFKNILSLNNQGQGMYAQGMYAEGMYAKGVYGGSVGQNQYINN